MTRAAAITHDRTGANKLWAGTVTIQPDAKTAAHHHGEAEKRDLCAIRSSADALGHQLECVAEAGAGDFVYVPRFVPRQEINASSDEELWCVLVRSRQERVVVNLGLSVVEEPEELRWVDLLHRDTRSS